MEKEGHVSQKQRSKSIRRSIVGAVAATAVAFGATALLPSAADAQVIQYNGTLTAGTINVRVGDATNARSISSPDLAGTMAASFDDVANTFSGTATFTPYTAPNQDVGFGLTGRFTIYLTQTTPFTGSTGGGGTTFTGTGTVRLAVKVEVSSTPADPASWQTFNDPAKCFVDISMPITGTSNGTTAVTVTSTAFTIPDFPTGATGCDSVVGGTTISDQLNAQLPGQNNNATLTYVGEATTTTTSTTTTSTTTTTTTTAPTTTTTSTTQPTTTTTSTTQPTTTTENPNQTTTTVDGTTTTTEATTTTTEATTTTTSTTQPTTTTTSGEGTTTTVPGTTSTTGIPVTLLPTTTTAPADTTTPTTAATTTTGVVTTTPSTEPTTLPDTVPTTAPDTSATTAPSSETTVAGGDVSGNDASNGGTGGGSTAGGSLARTGSDTTGQAVLGGTLLTIGGALVLGARRRRLGDA